MSNIKQLFECSCCSYKTIRRFNMDRHIKTHTMKKENDISLVCSYCNRSFISKYNLDKHILNCKYKSYTYECSLCKKKYGSSSSLSQHKKKCTGELSIKPSLLSDSTTNISIIQNITNNIQVNILPCPTSLQQPFNFNCEQITQSVLQKILNHSNNSFIRFNRFVGKVLEHPENQIIRKNNPKDNFSLIHCGDGQWEYAYDKDTLPIITHHMTTAALDKCRSIEQQANHIIYSIKHFEEQVREINEMDYESSTYKEILQRLKLAIVNFSQKLIIDSFEIKTLTNEPKSYDK